MGMVLRFLRNKYLQSGSLVLFACLLFAFSYRYDRRGSIQIEEEYLKVDGLLGSYEFMLIADSHISLCDGRDAGLQQKADSRRMAFYNESGHDAARTFSNLIGEAKRRGPDLTILAGDITDSAMYESIDFVKSKLDYLDLPYLYVLGNHDFEYGDEYFSKKAYREYFPRLKCLTKTDRQYVITEYDEFVVIGINDKNNQLPKDAVNAAMPYIKGSKPVFLVLHVPLLPKTDDFSLEKKSNDVWGLSKNGHCRVLLGENACEPNRTTKKLLDAVFAADSPVAAVFAGHIHFYHRDMLSGSAQQLVTGAAYYGDAVYIHVTGE